MAGMNNFGGKKAPAFTSKTSKVPVNVKKKIAKKKIALAKKGVAKPNEKARGEAK